MKLHSARSLALLLAALLVSAGTAHAQQYPYSYANYYGYQGEQAPPPPGAPMADPAAAAPGAAWAAPPVQQPGMAVYPPAADGQIAMPGQGCGGCGQEGCCNPNCCNPGCCNEPYDLGCCDCCQPHYVYTRIDVLLMDRSNPRNQPITSQGAPVAGVPGPIVLGTGGLGFPIQPFGRFLIGAPISHQTAVELSYLGMQNWQSQQFVQSAAGNLFSAYTAFGTATQGLPVGDVDQSVQQGIRYGSRLHNAEFNFVTCIPCSHSGRGHWNLVHGFRWIEINERFTYATVGAGGAAVNGSISQVNTFNDLVGYQGGLRWEYDLRPRLHFTVEPKVGVFANFSRMSSAFNTTAFPATISEFARRDEVAVAADCSALLSYDIKPWLTIRGGYNVMYVGGVALAPENFVPQPLPGGFIPRTANVNNTGAILYHGGSVGVEARF
ncbi:MAG: hypothetical protein AB7O62_25665 [Pirellulales bacterium]